MASHVYDARSADLAHKQEETSQVPLKYQPNVFEGSEKRIDIQFVPIGPTADVQGLRLLPRETIDELMSSAACTVVSQRSNAFMDAYVLSESSLFVYPLRYVLKTCGTTQPLKSLPTLLRLAERLGLRPAYCKYSRASFLFPEYQVFPHQSFDDECAFLREYVEWFGGDASAYVLGDFHQGLKWHIYEACFDSTHGKGNKNFTLEVCMTELDPMLSRQFHRTDSAITAKDITMHSGIQHLLPFAEIDDFLFDPCGYSMNGIDGSQFITIHITPEDGFSYASVEISGFEAATIDVKCMIDRICKIFNPGQVSVSLSSPHVDNCPVMMEFIEQSKSFNGFDTKSCAFQELYLSGSMVSFLMLQHMSLREALEDMKCKVSLPCSMLPGTVVTSSASSDSECEIGFRSEYFEQD